MRPIALLHLLALLSLPSARAQEPPAGVPTSVVIAGSLQSEAGCPGDWDPACEVTALAFDSEDQTWQATIAIPAGSYEYKAALNGGWEENYGQHGQLNGASIPLSLAAPAAVKFYYSDATHWVTDDRSASIATVPGSFQSEAGCAGDWAPECLRTWLQDVDGDGIHHLTLTGIPAGSHECKVAINESWDENYGLDGVPGGANIPFTQSVAGAPIYFIYDSTTHILSITGLPFVDGFESADLSAWSSAAP